MNSLEQAVDWMKDLQKFGVKPGLDRMKWMLERLNNPQDNIKFIHMAGTNGKGSTLQYISQVLQVAGYKVGTFISPAIDESFTSQIQINGQSIPNHVFISLIDRVKPLVAELEESRLGSPTEFEVTTVLALLYFSIERTLDFVAWETGLGGRLDSTNVIQPAVSVITNIGLDHTDILGATIQEIASEKAGIIKEGCPVITTETDLEASAILQDTAIRNNSVFYQLGIDFEVTRKTNDFSTLIEKFDFNGPFQSYEDLQIRMLGSHQVVNAGLAIMVLEVLRESGAIKFEVEHLVQGLKTASWPGRMEIVHRDPYIILDGAHNIAAMEALTTVLQERFSEKKIKVLFTALQDKDIKGIVGRLAPLCDEVFITEIDHPRAATRSKIQKLFRDSNPALSVQTKPTLDLCLQDWLYSADEQTVLLGTGSLYLIATIRKKINYMIVENSH